MYFCQPTILTVPLCASYVFLMSLNIQIVLVVQHADLALAWHIMEGVPVCHAMSAMIYSSCDLGLCKHVIMQKVVEHFQSASLPAGRPAGYTVPLMEVVPPHTNILVGENILWVLIDINHLELESYGGFYLGWFEVLTLLTIGICRWHCSSIKQIIWSK